ncbi:MAG TPA: acyltransferase family protein [Devosiaceae bacterium]|nr:acyltransferase family protein [Devosiaceae bacterium]
MNDQSSISVYTTVRRDDLQGLRAVAVLSVVIYHLNENWLPGGFIGVDIFFAISGFLITRILLKDATSDGHVHFLDFWAKRARRIVPNAAATLLAILAFTLVFVPSYRYGAVATDARAAALFIANVNFAELTVDYFHRNDLPSPILHFWSLAVEEQFYLLWPLAIGVCFFLIRRHALKLVVLLLVAIFALSFISALRAGETDAAAEFFLAQNRIWQLAAGGLVGALYHWLLRWPLLLRAVLAWAGAAGLAFGLFYLTGDLVYPGFWGLIPTLGTLALIVGMDANPYAAPLRAILASAPSRWVGDRSFSLYLWHWPVIAFGGAYWAGQPWLASLEIAAALLLAVASYALVERPVLRLSLDRYGRPRMIGMALLSLGVVVLVSSVLIALPIASSGQGRSAAVAAAGRDMGVDNFDGCHLSYAAVDQPPCAFGDLAGSHTVVLFGDSHASQWFTPLVAAATATGWKVNAWTKSSCPSADVSVWYAPRRVAFAACDAWREEIFSRLVSSPPALVILANLWPYDGELLDPASKAVLHGVDAQREMARGTEATIQRLNTLGIKVVLIRDTPRMPTSSGGCLASGANDCGNSRSLALNDDDGQLALAGQLGGNARFEDFTNWFCDGSFCPAMKGHAIIYRDSEHVTASYAGTLTPQFAAILRTSQ